MQVYSRALMDALNFFAAITGHEDYNELLVGGGWVVHGRGGQAGLGAAAWQQAWGLAPGQAAHLATVICVAWQPRGLLLDP